MSVGDKVWNDATDNWEKDGQPYTYRVTWSDIEGNQSTKDFADVDQGWDYYQDRQKDSFGATWDHIPPGE